LTKDNSPQAVAYSFLEDPTPHQVSQIIDLYRMAEWWSDDVDHPEQIERLVSGSHCYCIASVGCGIIGIGRAISDGASDAYIQDITVSKPFRRRGIASRIVQQLVARLKQDGLGWIGLIAERDTQAFYTRIGFEPMSNSTPMLLKKQ